ncbi:MAG: peptide chain release factor N(5)-glutamine methyltransferase [Ruminococcus sp.]|jgi:release factor glutamine methyltransferase|uniref:peptide chain release factor N(5)-glutamine methyltransferase n=1 Tax=Ruminococcus sp. TaxID=41978 RepID=UPI0026DF2D11|nr:peptide chain release factor N(5)-glutamine methyltransferase [uncultured Ruminococcus sp.]
MTVGEAYRKTKDILTEAGFETPAFEALCLTEKVFGFNRLALITKGEETVASEEKLAVLAELTEKRLNHEPLQYLLGKWSFMGIDLLVGEGVLVPRDDTEVVTSLCIDYLSCKESPNVIDLCAGSGAISLALEKYANCKVTAVELSDKAFSYLTQNIKLNNSAVNALNGDIFECHKDIADNSLDLIVSNPPYIKTADIASLQKEVQHEPAMALDGGESGLDFYRRIVPLWKSKLKAGGALAFELGEGQYDEVSRILADNGFGGITESIDFGGVQRAIIGTLLQK